MLSPASLRVCCLAVMAPALTKADRRTNCLPVGLSDPFCVSKTVTSENRKDKIDPVAKCVSLPSKRKPPHKIWVRTNAAEIPTNKNRISAIGLGTEFLNGKLRLHDEPRHKTWHGTDARTVAATKVKLKYTMNKNNSSLKNMGLAKANTSLGLHSMKRMDRISQLSHHNKRNSSGLEKEVGDNLPDLTDPTSSDLETTFSIVRIVQPALEQSIEEVSSSSRNLIGSSQHETFVSLSDSDSTLPVLADTSSVADAVSDNCSGPLSPGINTTLLTRDCVLPTSLPDSESPSVAGGQNVEEVNDALAHQQESIPLPTCDAPFINNTLIKNALSSEIDIQGKSSSPTTSDHILNASINEVNPLSSASHVVSFVDNCATEGENDLPAQFDDDYDMLPFSPSSPPLSPRCGDMEAASPCSSVSSSSTLSADEPIPLSPTDEAADMAFFSFPDSLLGPDPKPRAEVPTYIHSHVPCTTIKSWFDNLPEPGEQRNVMHLLNNVACCSLQKHEQVSLTELLTKQEKSITDALKETEVILRKYMVEHVQTQIKTLVSHLQNKFATPCQRQPKSDKEMVDLKAELLQSEDVRSLSTAALVSLVRKLENGTLPERLLQSQTDCNVQDSELVPTDEQSVTFEAEDYEDIGNTSNVLLANMKSLLRSADAEMTESSDEGSDLELESSLEDAIQKRALWKFMKERAALTSRSTWLVARIHELENQLNTVTDVLKKVSASIGDVPFEQEQVLTTALSTAGSGGASLQAAKLSRPKGLGRPVNGYLDHAFGSSCMSAIAEAPCSRTRALKTSAFHKRKLLVTTGMHLTNPKIAKLSTVGCECNCQDDIMPCILCTGRYNCVQSVDPDALPLLERVALLDPSFHHLLSFEKDIPLHMHFENVLKKNESQYQTVRPVSPVLNHRRRFDSDSNHYGESRSRRKINRYARTLLSAKYRNKKHFRKHKLVFGKWRKFQNKSTFHARDRIRRLSVASSASSHDSPVPSPCSEDGFGYDFKRRRDDNQFDIDDVIIPYSSKRGRLVKFEFKDIEIPSWRSKAFDNLQSIEIEEDTSDAAFIKRHEGYEIEERKIIRNGGGAKCFFNTWQKRSSRMNHRSDSRADSSGANTPDPVLLYDQDIMFQDTNSQLPSNPPSPALSPPMTPSSIIPISDDSQPALRSERRRSAGGSKRIDEPSTSKVADYDEVAPYEPRVFPLSEETVEGMLAEDDHTRDDTDVTMSGPSCPASPESTASSTSTVEDEDVADPEWKVALRDGPEQNIVIKITKR